jgi:hypothetical protein
MVSPTYGMDQQQQESKQHQQKRANVVGFALSNLCIIAQYTVSENHCPFVRYRDNPEDGKIDALEQETAKSALSKSPFQALSVHD